MTIIRNWTESSPSTPSVSMEHALYTADGWGRGAMSAKPTDLTVEIMQTSQMRESVPPSSKESPRIFTFNRSLLVPASLHLTPVCFGSRPLTTLARKDEGYS